MIYFDNGATSGFKPYSVIDSATNCIKYMSANPGRSGHRLSVAGAKIVYKAREEISSLFSSDCPEKVIFTKNCTEALNLAIIGTVKKGGHVITTVYEHNSVLRPLHELYSSGIIDLDIVSPTANLTLAKAIESKIKDNTYLVVVNHVSNVNGEENDVFSIGKMLKEKGILFLVDSAQSAGHIPIDIKKNNISLLAVAGHKGLCGIMGSGALVINKETEVEPITFGGTGTDTFSLTQPNLYPEKLESGTLNLPAISALHQAVLYTKENLHITGNLLKVLTAKLISELKKIEKIKLYSSPNPFGIVAFEILGTSSSDVADLLSTKFDVAVRGGFHCAPLMHEFLGTSKNGLVRASLSAHNTSGEVRRFIDAIKQITLD